MEHRGPGEVELANLMFGDDPAMLLAAAGRAANEMPQPVKAAGSEAKLSERMASNARASRELAYDTTIRFTHELRIKRRRDERERLQNLRPPDVITVS